MNWPPRVLIVAPESPDRNQLQKIFSDSGVETLRCSTLLELESVLSGQFVAAVFCQDPLPDGDLPSVIAEVGRYQEEVPVVALAKQSDWDAYLRTLYAGAFDCLAMPPAPLEARRVLWSAIHAFTASHAGAPVAA